MCPSMQRGLKGNGAIVHLQLACTPNADHESTAHAVERYDEGPPIVGNPSDKDQLFTVRGVTLRMDCPTVVLRAVLTHLPRPEVRDRRCASVVVCPRCCSSPRMVTSQ